MKLPFVHLDLAVIEEIPIPLWRKLLAVVGVPHSLPAGHFSHAALLAALQGDTLSGQLLEALEAIHLFGSEEGREAVAEAMADQRVDTSSLPTGVGERELAVHLYLAKQHDVALADVFARARLRLQQGSDARGYYEFAGRRTVRVSNLKQLAQRLEVVVLEHCRAHDLGDHVEVHAFRDDEMVVFHVLHTYRQRRPLAVAAGQRTRSVLSFRPVHGDVVRYDSRLGRLRVAARAPSMVRVYRRIVGEVLDGDGTLFSGEPVCTLKPLQRRRQAVLEDHRLPGIHKVRLTECTWRRGDRRVVELRTPDCFSEIDELGLPLQEGELVSAKLKLWVAGSGTRPITATIKVPFQIKTRPAHQELVNEYLERIGVRSLEGGEDSDDLWSLGPGPHSETTWRRVFGRDMDCLVASGTLRPAQLGSVPHPDFPWAGATLLADSVGPHDFYGVSQEPAVPSRSLSPTDVDGLELDLGAFGRFLRARYGASGPPAATPRGVVDVGVVEVGALRFRLFYAVSAPPIDAGSRLAELALHEDQAVLLLPARGLGTTRLPEVPLTRALPDRASILRAIIAATRTQQQVPAVFYAPSRARLVVDRQLGAIWVDGVPITSLRCDTYAFAFVVAVAEAQGAALPRYDLGIRLAPSAGDPDGLARKQKLSAKHAIIDALADAGRQLDVGDPFPSGPAKHYRCALQPFVTP